MSKKREYNNNTSNSNLLSHSGSRNSNSNNSSSNRPLVPDLASYETALDPSLQSFDTILDEQTKSAIKQVSTADPFSLDFIRLVIGSIVHINEQVVQVILQSQEDIWRNPDLLDLVNDYFDNSTQTLALYSALDKLLLRSGNSLLFVKMAIFHFEKEKTQLRKRGNNENPFEKTLRELESFRSVGDPFTDEFFTAFHKVYDSQVMMLKKLQAKTSELDKKLKGLTSYRKVSAALFATGVAALVICSVVEAEAEAIVAPPLVAALLAVSSVLLGAMGKWMDTLWKGYENGVREELDLVFELEIETFTAVKELETFTAVKELETFTAVKELETIRILVEKLNVQIEGMVFKVGLVISQDDEVAVSLAIEEIKKRLRAFEEAVRDLGDHSNKSSSDIMNARKVVLLKIKNLPSSG